MKLWMACLKVPTGRYSPVFVSKDKRKVMAKAQETAVLHRRDCYVKPYIKGDHKCSSTQVVYRGVNIWGWETWQCSLCKEERQVPHFITGARITATISDFVHRRPPFTEE